MIWLSMRKAGFISPILATGTETAWSWTRSRCIESILPASSCAIIADVERPNGIAVSPDQKTLYVVDNNPSRGGARKVYAYALRPDGSVGARRVLHDFGTGRGGDGMCLDRDGNAYVTAGLNGGFSPEQDSSVKAGVYIVSPQGKSLGFIPVPEDSVTNCTFGGPELKTLYITAGTALWRIGLNARGLAFCQVRNGFRRGPEGCEVQVETAISQRFPSMICFAEPEETCLTISAPSPFTVTSGSFSSSSMPTSPDIWEKPFSCTQVKARRGTFLPDPRTTSARALDPWSQGCAHADPLGSCCDQPGRSSISARIAS